ncbi:BnaAnng19510D [Brassica napus]|uniref:BnaAnng19510D protein n=1 Tax=Brassica napus TaxID=3708 RepID=A0A078JGT0_BRANA|nr:BnaAnng19510D [Brassica napus]
MDMNNWFDRVKEDRKNLSFSKTFACADLSSECMRTFPFDLMKSLPKENLANKMVIIAKWGSSWEVDISKNPRFYYMEKSGWNQFVRDNALGKNEFVTFTHKGSMCFDVNIYGKDEKEVVRPPTMASSSGIKQEQGASMEGVEFEATEKKAEESKKKIKIKKVVNSVEIGESSRGVKKVKRGRVRVKNGVPEFEMTIKRSGLGHVTIPNLFKKHIPNEQTMFTIHSKGSGGGSWEVWCLVREAQATFSRGWSKLAREYPLEIGDKCTLQLIKPNECVLTIDSNKAKEEEITVID